MPNLIGASRVDIDGPLREEGQYAANIGNHKINFGKALQHPAVHQSSHRHRAVKGPAKDQGRHDIHSRGFSG